MARILDHAARHWWGEPARLWTERVPAAAGSAQAARALDAELFRPVRGLRVVLLDYADGAADLVLVAHRAWLDATSLRMVAEVLTERVPYERFHAGRAQVAAPDDELVKRWREADYSGAAVEWASGDVAAGERTGVVSVPVRDSAHLAARVAVAAALVLGRYEGRHCPVIGAVTGLPARPEEALGAFDAGTLLAVDLSGAATTGELVAGSARVLEGGGWCDARRYARLCAETGGRVLAGLLATATDEDVPCQTAPFPLTLVPRRDQDGSLLLDVRHRLGDVDGESARRFAVHVARAYERLAGDDDLAPADVDLLDEPERRHVTGLGRPDTPLGRRPERIEEIFAARAAERPEAVALTGEDRSLTYAELDALAGRRAAALRGRGVRAGDRVGLCLDRTPELVVTMLAVLKAGAVYVPMDPAYPAERLAYTAGDAALRVVVADRDFPAGDGLSVVSPERLADPDDGGVPRSGGADDAAYVIYTSGSTGRPKGVVVSHRNVVALLTATGDDLGLGPGDTWSNFHSSAFDFSVWEIWGALLTGGRLVMVPYWVSRSPEEFHELLTRERVTVLSQTPSAFAQLMEADRHRDERLAVRLTVFGGEPLDVRPLLGWFDRYPGCRLVNMYGITETTVHVTAQTVTRGDAIAGSRSVGRPLPGWHVYVLDERGRPVPVGAPGEIHVGGAGVATEYLGRPELTAERFVPDPFAGGRMYRSGDRGRLRADGRLEHLGRLDTQVKVRGFRIELDEIRNVLLDDPAVTSAAVVLRDGRPAAPGPAVGGAQADGEVQAVGDAQAVDHALARLDAYVTPADLDPAEVRRRAAKVLPDHMMPATVTALPALPLTANGKLDARALPEPASAPPAPAAPAEDFTRTLAAVWESVLDVPVGDDDNFFELGGNSLLAIRLAAAMRERDLPALPLRELYLHPTVRDLAQVLGHE
ncbi:amino acid adenylation domain-containing protein [Nonomuraea mesophila]|uniref:Amino acid adenylation domain-containing protein n=2 Tax=Nonomuraea mesophila TaxID=2530382 RepID=A0A4R5F7X7_9ACTN|nr:amino acid adenylation domain-containing protein [Nonomuraea mesophila]